MKSLLTEALAQLQAKKYFGPEISKGNTKQVQRMGTHRGQKLYGVGDVYSQEKQKLKMYSNEDPIQYSLLRIFTPHQKISASASGSPVVFY